MKLFHIFKHVFLLIKYRKPEDTIYMDQNYIRPDNLSERDNQVLYSPSRSEFSYIHSQHVSGTTTPIHDREIADMLIMDSKLGERLTYYGLETKIIENGNNAYFEFDILPNYPDLLS